MEKKEYFVGLDMGTSSVGWAVTDMEYNLMRAKGKDMWGVRLFSEANTAAERRGHRTSRRNLKRKKVREGLLWEIFSNEIEKIDPGFKIRLKESKYYLEDKSNKTPFVLFADNGYTDKEYYNQYPTIFHLIDELASEKGKEPHDVRLVYLACLNIFKHRGHFLNENLTSDGIDDISELSNDFVNRLRDYNESIVPDDKTKILDVDNEDFIKSCNEILCNKRLSITAKKREMISALSVTNKSKYITEMITLVCGGTANISNMFPKEDYDDDQKKQKLCFKSSSLEEDLPKVESMVTTEEYGLVCTLKRIHDWSVVSIIMGESKSISEARVKSYEKHQEDLKKLKKLYKDYKNVLPANAYNMMFRDMIDGSYSAYVGKVNNDKATQTGNNKTRMQRRGAKATREDLYTRIKKDLEKVPDEEKREIFEEMEANLFLPKQLTDENGAIPYQLHMMELKKILVNASTYLTFLNIKDETGLTKAEKIVKLFEFRIPYYVGPLYKDDNKKGNAWVIRKEEGKVYPWNFEDKIDVKESAEVFIERMIRHCTYLSDECALPKDSLLYERFRVLNELNNLSINGERVSVELKQNIYNNLFKKSKKRISKKMLIDYLIKNENVDKNVEVAGFDGTFANALLSYGKFREVWGVEILTDSQIDAAEEIVKWSTVYGDSKKFLREKISEKYGPNSNNKLLTNDQIKRILGLKFKEWGRLSKEFLYLEGADKDTGEILPVITRMWEENKNLMELLSDKYTYKETLNEKAGVTDKSLMEIDYEDLEDLYISAPVRRMTWQTLLILKEIYGIMGRAPKKIFVEMARSDEEKGKRKDSRKKKLEALYKSCKENTKHIEDLKKDLAVKDEAALRSKKLYLYYMQKGKCMYSGDAIDIGMLFTNDYNIDHIYPQTAVKDDSLENNMVLVKCDLNNKKSDNYPVFPEWQNNMHSFWTVLKEEGFITTEKYNRLTRKEELTDDELANFVNRQLVETRQATKVIAELMKNSFAGECKIVYAKAGNVSEFRHKFSSKYDKETGKSKVINPEFVKCRIVNDFHHANDAYLNIVVGNVYDVKFTSNPYNYIKEYKKQLNSKDVENRERYHMDKIFDFDVVRGGEVAWRRWGDNRSLDIVKRVMQKNTPIVTRMSYEASGEISKATVWSALKASSGVGYIPVKFSDKKLKVSRYGGFSTVKVSNFFVVEHTVKGERVRTIEAMPLYLKGTLNTKEKMEEWCADKENGLGLINPDVRFDRIKMYSRIRIDGFDLCLTGKSGNTLLTSNETQLKIEGYWRYYIKKLTEYDEKESEVVNNGDNIKLYDVILEKNCKGIYKKRQSPIGQRLVDGRNTFVSLELDKQVETLMGIIKVFAFENQGFDLRGIGGSKASGKMVPNKKISDKESVLLINQSVTGLYENVIDLLKV